MAKEHWMQEAFSHNEGKLHRELGVPEGETIPAGKLEKASHSKSATVRKEVALARTGRKYGGRHKHSGRQAAAALASSD